MMALRMMMLFFAAACSPLINTVRRLLHADQRELNDLHEQIMESPVLPAVSLR